MQQQLDDFIQALPKKINVETIAYQPENILNLIATIKKQYPDTFIFEKNLKKTEHHEASFSLIAFHKLLEVKYNHQTTVLTSSQKQLEVSENPILILKKILHYYSHEQEILKNLHEFFPFLIGRVSYDFVSFVEPGCCDIKKNDFETIKANLYQHYLLFDHDKKTASFVRVGDTICDVYSLLSCPGLTRASLGDHRVKPGDDRNVKSDDDRFNEVSTDISDQDFASMIESAKKHIVDGDIFQIVLSRNFYYPVNHSSFFIYQALRTISDAAFLFYFQEDDKEYLGASPEKLVSVKNNLVEVCPLAGTRKRVHSLSEKFVEEELLSDEKENAEHMMLVDLARNDVGSISKSGSVLVDKLKQLKKYSHVMHLSSSVKGILKDDFDAFNALMHCFPAGTLTGAPKIRAIQLIDQLETSNRNFYGGAIFMMDLENNMESCIAIRMAEVSKNVAKIRTGAGIVFDSENSKEILETKNKANLLLHAIMLSKEYADDIAN